MPPDLKIQIEEAAAGSGRSINSEIIARLRASVDGPALTSLTQIPDGLLLDEVIQRYGARVQIIVETDVAAQLHIDKTGVKTSKV